MIDPVKLAKAAKLDGNLAYAQRLGWLLERAGYTEKAKPLARWVARKKPLDVKLEPSLPIRGSERNKRWSLRVNTRWRGTWSDTSRFHRRLARTCTMALGRQG